jgi:hypothetical protein
VDGGVTRRPELVALGSVAIGVAIFAGKLVVSLLLGAWAYSARLRIRCSTAASGFTLFAVRTINPPTQSIHTASRTGSRVCGGVILVITAGGIAVGRCRLVVSGRRQPRLVCVRPAVIPTVIEAGRGACAKRRPRVGQQPSGRRYEPIVGRALLGR